MKRQDKKKRTKDLIIRAALELFYEKGFHETTVKEITERANIAKGTFFNYFPTKESIMLTLAEERVEALELLISKGYFMNLSINRQFEALLNHVLAYYEVDPKLTIQTWTHVIQTENPLLPFWKVLLERGILRGEIKKQNELDDWCQIINSHFFYVLTMHSEENSKEQLRDQFISYIQLSLSAILEQRGTNTMKKLVILGGGYGGMRIIQKLLDGDLPEDIQLTLVDRLPYHCLKTEYYALAAGTAADHHLRISFPEDPRLIVKYGSVSSIDLENEVVHFENQETLEYDYLIIGLGCEDKYHGVPGAPEHTLSIQTIDKSRKTFETLNNLAPQSCVGIVGAGLSGVELASELRESRPDLSISLFDRGERILSSFPKRLSSYVQDWFIEHNVNLVHNSNITKVEENTLFNNGEPVHCDAIVWTAGIQPNHIVRALDVETDKSGRVVLSPHHHLPNNDKVFVVGDCASLPNAPSAQLAEVQGEQIVTVLFSMFKGEALPELPKMKLKGVMGSLGKKHGFGLMGNTALTGRVARLLKSGILWMYKYHNG